MKADLTLVREPTDRTLPPSIFVPAERPPHRPVGRYIQVRIHSEEDAEAVRRVNLPLHLLTAKRVTDLGYPIRFPTRLVVARSLLPIVESKLGTIPFASENAARSPRPEDVAVAMLRFDMIGARALLDRNPRWELAYLTRRIWEEDLGRRATFVRFFDVLPLVPKEGEALDRASLERKLRKNSAGTGF
ncbi:MAG: hypothetical protein ABSA63_09090 [Thermoplasmata archaeon]|jgi:hypothetical protein